jgi:hypothetical protein
MSDPLNDAFAKSIRQRVRAIMLSNQEPAEKGYRNLCGCMNFSRDPNAVSF